MKATLLKEVWRLLQNDTELMGVLPPRLRQYLQIPFENLLELKTSQQAEDYSEITQPSIEEKAVTKDYLNFLKNQIVLNPRGDEWKALLQKRHDLLQQYLGKKIITVRLNAGYTTATVRVDPPSRSVLDWEIFS